jgi:toxin ParE1/3/4
MVKYNIKIFSQAKKDLEDIIDYLNTLSPNAAIRYYDDIIEKIGSLSVMPDRCPKLKLPQLRQRGYRILVIKNYSVFFIINARTIEVRRILYGRRKFEWFL